MKQFIYIVLVTSLLGLQTQLSADAKTDQSIKLAMLDLSQHGFVVAKKNTLNKVPAEQSYSSNCMEWTDWQIKQKAKPFNKSIIQHSRQYGVDSNLVKAVITAESCFKTKALSHAGARGLMQLIPATAKRFGVSKSYHPDQNIRGGVKYLKFLLERYKGDLIKSIAAYNAGEGKVDRYKGVPPYKETQQYVKNVLKVYARLKPKRKKVQTHANGHISVNPVVKKAVYQPPKLGQKPGRHGWQFNRKLAPHLYKH